MPPHGYLNNNTTDSYWIPTQIKIYVTKKIEEFAITSNFWILKKKSTRNKLNEMY